ncbi:dihydropteroate synthase, partial [Nonlabens mediterrranea]|nr:dihydropteroate synthase [Nonlabens mediterrranea]
DLREIPESTGISRKSMIYKTLESSASQALNGTSALHMICLQQGASILRVHDVKEANEVIQLYHMLETN